MIKKATYKGDYKILVLFSDGTEKLADFSRFIQESKLSCVRKYMDKNLFRKFRYDDWGLSWGDNEFDINPMNIYNGLYDLK